ncbi:MAG: hypothetical protein OXR68_06680 [Alphaproteobacteria bacterium]|nr:hypothetical protein [Alphaproteobacteria bacterium]MDD9920289.1 hypothetical protein [Alphaproteobacteria bacterium]
MQKQIVFALVCMSALSGCKYYGSSLPPEYPISMDDALAVANDSTVGSMGAQRPTTRRSVRPRVEQPSYIPEKELAMVSPPKTLLVWTYPHITDDNKRVFGNWSTIFLTDRYEWIAPANATPADEMLQQPMFAPPAGSP